MRILASSALVLSLFVPQIALGAQKETETVDRTVSIGDRGTLKLNNFSGDVRITGTSGGDVVIHAVRRATRERLDAIKLEINTNGSSVTIDANKRVPDYTENRTTSSRPTSISRCRGALRSTWRASRASWK
jgi:hypothetical protein